MMAGRKKGRGKKTTPKPTVDCNGTVLKVGDFVWSSHYGKHPFPARIRHIYGKKITFNYLTYDGIFKRPADTVQLMHPWDQLEGRTTLRHLEAYTEARRLMREDPVRQEFKSRFNTGDMVTASSLCGQHQKFPGMVLWKSGGYLRLITLTLQDEAEEYFTCRESDAEPLSKDKALENFVQVMETRNEDISDSRYVDALVAVLRHYGVDMNLLRIFHPAWRL